MTPRTKSLAYTITSQGHDDKTEFRKRIALSKAITLIESHSRVHMEQADLLLNYLYQSNVDTPRDNFRVGFAGPPGSGKSSFIEKFGQYILNHQEVKNTDFKPEKLAVVCIDPSSVITGGSILGDKTRMKDLSLHPKAYVRPSPSKGILGGLSSYTNDVTSLCLAANYELVLVESVGIGQSECGISNAVDMVVLLVAPGGGDSLQGVKKGILEVADMLIVNKADGSLLPAARATAADYKAATHFFRSRMKGWEAPPVLLASADTGEGIQEIWEQICNYRNLVIANGELHRKRTSQKHYWMMKHLEELISDKIKSDNEITMAAEKLNQDLDQGVISTRAAATQLFDLISMQHPVQDR
jgi:LAO/AO transport system kinase